MKIFDAHYHIDKNYEGCAFEAVHRNVIFNAVEQYKEKHSLVRDTDFSTLIFDFKNDENLSFIRRQIAEKKIQGLKIHSKIQRIVDAEYETLFTELEKTSLDHLVITVDAFYSGHDYTVQPNLARIIALARLFPNVPFVIAHSGGIKVLEYFMHLRTLPNVYFDLAFSLAYLKYTSVIQDFRVLLKFGNPEKIIFGTDYPFISDADQLAIFKELANDAGLSETAREQILFENANKLFHKQ